MRYSDADTRADGCTDGRTDSWTNSHTDGCANAGTGECPECTAYVGADGYTDRCSDACSY